MRPYQMGAFIIIVGRRMAIFKILGVVAGAVALGAAALGALSAGAQTVCNNYSYPSALGCGTVTVYVQVSTAAGLQQRFPSDFSVGVVGQNPWPSSFPGSSAGTRVALGPGYYNFSVANNPYGYSVSYSGHCSGSMNNGDSLSCTITLTSPSSYQYYPYLGGQLFCSPKLLTVRAGETAMLTATGGSGAYSWNTTGATYSNYVPTFQSGNTYSATYPYAGSHTITVRSGNQTDVCTINVTGTPAPYTASPYYPAPTYPASPTYPTYPGAPVAQYPTYPYPTLPNTGVAPAGALGALIAVILLGVAGIAIYPHARKAFTIATR